MTSKKPILLALLLIFFFVIIFFVLTSVYLFFRDPINPNFSFFRSFRQYYPLLDWNLPHHAYVDLDKDGQKDMVTFTGCAFLTSLHEGQIPKDRRCQEPSMSIIGFPDKPNLIGQKLFGQQLETASDLTKTALIQTEVGEWCYYYLNKFNTKIYCLDDQKQFVSRYPVLLDRLDTAVYFLSHLGLPVIFRFLSLVSHGAV